MENGKGVQQNYQAARKWYQNAAVLNNSWAMNNLGTMYANGRGAKTDLQKAAQFNDRCLEKEPASIYALSKRAVIIYKTADKAQGKAQLARLAEEYAPDAEKLGTIGWAYYLCGELDQAQETNRASLAVAELPWNGLTGSDSYTAPIFISFQRSLLDIPILSPYHQPMAEIDFPII